MKAFLIAVTLLFSSSVFSASLPTIKQQASIDDSVTMHPDGSPGFSRSCSGASCSVTLSSPPFLSTLAYFEENVGPFSNVYGGLFVDDGNIYWSEMGFYATFIVSHASKIWFNWDSTGLGGRIKLPGNAVLPSSGSAYALMQAGDVFVVDFLGYANSADARFTLNMSAASVPLPASLLLFAPALLGLIGFRRKLF